MLNLCRRSRHNPHSIRTGVPFLGDKKADRTTRSPLTNSPSLMLQVDLSNTRHDSDEQTALSDVLV